MLMKLTILPMIPKRLQTVERQTMQDTAGDLDKLAKESLLTAVQFCGEMMPISCEIGNDTSCLPKSRARLTQIGTY